MSKLVFKLRDVPEDEAQDVRDLLSENNIEFYETHAGNWGIAMAGIWIKEDESHAHALELINEYELARSEKFHQEHIEMESEGMSPTLLSNFLDSPLRFIVYIFCIFVVLYISVVPFIQS